LLNDTFTNIILANT